jgi:hypothetical protein
MKTTKNRIEKIPDGKSDLEDYYFFDDTQEVEVAHQITRSACKSLRMASNDWVLFLQEFAKKGNSLLEYEQAFNKVIKEIREEVNKLERGNKIIVDLFKAIKPKNIYK